MFHILKQSGQHKPFSLDTDRSDKYHIQIKIPSLANEFNINPGRGKICV